MKQHKITKNIKNSITQQNVIHIDSQIDIKRHFLVQEKHNV